jgi:hypothetical protein
MNLRFGVLLAILAAIINGNFALTLNRRKVHGPIAKQSWRSGLGTRLYAFVGQKSELAFRDGFVRSLRLFSSPAPGEQTSSSRKWSSLHGPPLWGTLRITPDAGVASLPSY